MGVELTRMGGDALEAYYRRTGRPDQAESLEWAREGALGAARKARAGHIPEDIRGLLQGVPDLVENEEALRGLRWEYFATFNMLAPCINLHLAESGVVGTGGQELQGFLPRFLSLVLGSGGAPGSCASLIASLQS